MSRLLLAANVIAWLGGTRLALTRLFGTYPQAPATSEPEHGSAVLVRVDVGHQTRYGGAMMDKTSILRAQLATVNAMVLWLFVLGLLLAACDESPMAASEPASDANGDAEHARPQLTVEPQEAPIELPPGALFYADVPYGDHPERNILDLMVPDIDGDAPFVVFLHGGGFASGSKDKIYESGASNAVAFLEQGFAVAAVNYRFLGNDEGVIRCLNDSRYALQFLRYHASYFGLDPTWVGLYGSSAGAGTSLWIGSHDDMANPNAEDPVERMSTRVSAVSLSGTQATYDLRRWETDVFADFGITLELAAFVAPQLVPTLQRFYGLDDLSAEETIAALDSPAIIAYRATVDMLALIDPSDPPIRISSGGSADLPTTVNSLFHHPYHGREIREAAQAAGVDVVVNLPGMDVVDDGFPMLVDFFLDAYEATP